MNIVIVGGGTAGVSSALAARKNNPESRILLLTSEGYVGYQRCALPLLFTREVSPDSMQVIPIDSLRHQRIEVLTGVHVSEIKPEDRILKTTGGDIGYDRLILCVGNGSPLPANISGIDSSCVFRLYGIGDGINLAEKLRHSTSIAILGSLLVGMEVLLLARKKFYTTLIDDAPSLRLVSSVLDDWIGSLIEEDINRYPNTDIRLDVSFDEVEISEKGILVEGELIEADIVVDATERFSMEGISLARDAGIEIGETGGIKVRNTMETSVENIYAAGDCIEFVNFAGMPQKSFTEPLAIKEGEVAGINASGGTKYLLPLLIPYVMAFDTIQFGWVGMTPLTRVKELGIETVAGFGESNGRLGHIPEMELTRCLLIFDKNSCKLIGAETVGGKDIKWRIDLLSLAIREGFTPEKILNMDLSFKPFASLMEEPLFLAAEDALQKMG